MRKPGVPLLPIHDPAALGGSRSQGCELTPPKDQITMRLDLENLILDRARRRKEGERLQEGLPDLDATSRSGDRRLATFMTR